MSKLYFKEQMFSWFGKYEIYNENGDIKYIVEGKMAIGNELHIYDLDGNELAILKQKIFSFLPTYEIYKNNQLVSKITKEISFLKLKFTFDHNGWYIEGNYLEWDYKILKDDVVIAMINKEIWRLTDTYILDVKDDNNDLDVLLLVLSIDIEKERRND